MRLQPVQNGVLTAGELLAAGLAFEIQDRLLFSMAALSDQGVDVIIRDPEIFAIWVRTKITLGGYFLDWTAATFSQTPGRGHFWFGRSLSTLFFHAERAIPFAFGFHHERFTGLCCAFLFLEEASKPIPPQKMKEFKTKNQNRKDYQ